LILALLLTLSPTVDLAAVGDVMLGRYVGRRIAHEGVDSVFGSCSKELRGADLALGNLECVLSRRSPTENKQIRLVADPLLATSLASAGFDGMSVANNHALDCGSLGLADTMAALHSARIRAIDGRIQVVAVKGIRIALLAFSDFDEGTGLGIVGKIRQVRTRADVIVIMWHWGNELSPVVSKRQKTLAKEAAKAGADVILGAHPHVLQPIEWLPTRSQRRCLVAYSLGNFIFDARPGAERRTGILHVTLDKTGAKSYRLSPYHIERGAPKPD